MNTAIGVVLVLAGIVSISGLMLYGIHHLVGQMQAEDNEEEK